MRRFGFIFAGLLAFVVVDKVNGQTHQSCPPGMNNDRCDEWQAEEAQHELSSVLTKALEQIDTFATPETRQEAKEQLNRAQQLWADMRAADCQSESAFFWLRSARSRKGYTASCLYLQTTDRIVEIKKRYLLPS
jgi:uncharacterized protein YecT (DUF1311 family)